MSSAKGCVEVAWKCDLEYHRLVWSKAGAAGKVYRFAFVGNTLGNANFRTEQLLI